MFFEEEKNEEKKYNLDEAQQILRNQISLKKVKGPNDQVVHSSHLNQYLGYNNIEATLDFQKQIDHRKVEQLMSPQLPEDIINALSANNIQYHLQKFCPFNIVRSKTTKNYRVIQLDVEIGYFTLKILILNERKYKLPQNSLLQSGYDRSDKIGSFGLIQFFYLQNRILKQISSFDKEKYKNQFIPNTGTTQYATKNIEFKKYLSKRKQRQNFYCLNQFIMQYSLCKIASCLEAGLKVYCFSGFDLTCYFDSIQFCMEKGQTVSSVVFPQSQQLYSFKNSLFQLHKLRIIHNDIKTDNLMYSPSLKKIVFIDFGLSEVIEQKWGEKTFTKFKGSYLYAGDQMKDIIIKQQGYVDLYWNDMCCLQKVIRIMEDFFKSDSPKTNQKKKNSSQNFQQPIFSQYKKTLKSKNDLTIQVVHNLILYSLYLKKFQTYEQLFLKYLQIAKERSSDYQTQKKRLINQTIMPFLQELENCPFLDEIYKNFYQSYRKSKDFEELKTLTYIINQNQNQQNLSVFYYLYCQIVSQNNIKLRNNFSQIYEPLYKSLKNNEQIKDVSWKVIMKQLSTTVKEKLSLINISQLNSSQSHQTQYSELQKQACLSICQLLAFSLNVIYNSQNQKTEIVQYLLPIFKGKIISLIQREYQRSHNRQSARLMKNIKADLLKKVEQITSEEEQMHKNLKQNSKKSKKKRAIKYYKDKNVNKILEQSVLIDQEINKKYLFNYDQQLLVLMVRFIESQLIQDQKLYQTLVANEKMFFVQKAEIFYINISDKTNQQKVLMFLFASYRDFEDMEGALRILEIIKNTFSKQDSQIIEWFCLIKFIRRFHSDMRYSRCIYYYKRCEVLFWKFVKNHKKFQQTSLETLNQLNANQRIGQSTLNNCKNTQEALTPLTKFDIFLTSDSKILDFKRLMDWEIQQYELVKSLNYQNSQQYLQKVVAIKKKIESQCQKKFVFSKKHQLLHNFYIKHIFILSYLGQFQECLQVFKVMLEKFDKYDRTQCYVNYGIIKICNFNLKLEKQRQIKDFSILYHGFSWYQCYQKEQFFQKIQKQYFRSLQQQKAFFRDLIQKNQILQSEAEIHGQNNFYTCKIYIKILDEICKRGIPQLSSVIISKMLKLCQRICQQTVFDKKIFIKVDPLQKINNMSEIIEGFCHINPHKRPWKKQFPAFFYIYQRLLKKQLQDQSLYPAEYWLASSFSIIACRQSNYIQTLKLQDQQMRKMCKYCPINKNYSSLKIIIHYIQQRVLNLKNQDFVLMSQIQPASISYSNNYYAKDAMLFDNEILFEIFKAIRDTHRLYYYFHKINFLISFMWLLIYHQKIEIVVDLIDQLGKFCRRMGGKKNFQLLHFICSWLQEHGLQQQSFKKMYSILNQQYSFHSAALKNNPEMLIVFLNIYLKTLKFDSEYFESQFFDMKNIKRMTVLTSQMNYQSQQYIKLIYYKIFLILSKRTERRRKERYFSIKIMRTNNEIPQILPLINDQRKEIIKGFIKDLEQKSADSECKGSRKKKKPIFVTTIINKLIKLKEKINT